MGEFWYMCWLDIEYAYFKQNSLWDWGDRVNSLAFILISACTNFNVEGTIDLTVIITITLSSSVPYTRSNPPAIGDI